ncbi:MAG: hypothetical protein V7606_1661, partial [Burkholderiales bacterium]
MDLNVHTRKIASPTRLFSNAFSFVALLTAWGSGVAGPVPVTAAVGGLSQPVAASV